MCVYKKTFVVIVFNDLNFETFIYRNNIFVNLMIIIFNYINVNLPPLG